MSFKIPNKDPNMKRNCIIDDGVFPELFEIHIFPLLSIVERIKNDGKYRSYSIDNKFFFEWIIEICGSKICLIKSDGGERFDYTRDYYKLMGEKWEISFIWDRRNHLNETYVRALSAYGVVDKLRVKNYEQYKSFMALIALFGEGNLKIPD